jgi:2,3-bisphosphoglycerate-dependent phosphoglycerate mutase/probable phosphoglycerate mutase
MGRLILVRHGESRGNRERIFANSPHDLPLTELGYQQAQAAARRIGELFRPSLVVSSEFVRASETARVIAEALGVPLRVEGNLHEREVGVHRGLSYDSLAQAPDYDAMRPWAWKPAGGESYEEVQARAAPIMDRLAAAHPDDDVVLVSHGGVMVSLWAHAAADWNGAYIPPNCGMVLIEHGPAGYSLPQAIDISVGATDAGG